MSDPDPDPTARTDASAAEIERRLAELGITLPAPAVPAAAYVPFVRSGRLVWLSGHIARRDGRPWVGRLGEDMSTDEGRAAARSVAVDLLGTLNAALAQDGGLAAVARIVKVVGLVNSAPSFTEQHLVTNGCSELLGQVLGAAGVHARSAYGVAALPLGACVEIELVAETR